MNGLYHAHSGLRYLVLLAAAVALVVLIVAISTNRTTSAVRISTAAFTGLLDLQILVGIALVLGGVFPDRAVGHLVMMVLAAAAAHGASMIAARQQHDRRALIVRLSGVLLATGLVAGGVMAIGRGLLGSGPMTPPGV